MGRPLKVEGLLVREKDKEWIARLPEMEDDVRKKFVSLHRKAMVTAYLVGIIIGLLIPHVVQMVGYV